jgi:hypothetical protein
VAVPNSVPVCPWDYDWRVIDRTTIIEGEGS